MGNKKNTFTMTKSRFQEKLVGLYLRLNGYFQTGYIPHSEIWGNAGTDIDRIALRLPFHSQPETTVKPSPELKIPDSTIDIIIAEVKLSRVEFNDTLKNLEKRALQNWEQIFRWIGFFNEKEIELLSPEAIDLVKLDGAKSHDNSFRYIERKNEFGVITIRPILFIIDEECEQNFSKLWIDGETMINYMWECFCPVVRDGCSTKYPFKLWGEEYEDIVNYFKIRHEQGLKKGTLQEMYKSFVNK